MAHWAELDDDDVVIRVIVCDPDDGADGMVHPPAFCTEVLGGRWARTFYDTPGREFAGIGYRHLGNGSFAAPEPGPRAAPDVEALLVDDPDFAKLSGPEKALVRRWAAKVVAPPAEPD